MTANLRETPPTGPHAVVIEHDQALATHTIYRPATLGASKHPVLVWGEGGCAKDGLQFPEFLNEIASHGVVVIADGPPVARTAPGGGAAPGAGGAAPAPRAGGRLHRQVVRRPGHVRVAGLRRQARAQAAGVRAAAT